MKLFKNGVSRRSLLKSSAAVGAGVVGASSLPRFAIGQEAKIKLGMMLPFSGTYAALGEAINNALVMGVEQNGGKLGGRGVEYVRLDDESDPGKAPQNANKLIKSDNVDFLIGTVHSGVLMGMVKVIRDTGTMTICPNGGAGAATGPLCTPNFFRTSFSNWQPAYPMGDVAADKGAKTAVVMSWKYGAGEEATGGFREAFEARGGKVVKEIMVPFPSVEWQAELTEIASIKPDCVFVFFAGGGAVKFVKDYAAAGLKDSIPLYGSGFLTEGTLAAQGEAAEGLLTSLHYADTLDNPVNKKFRADYENQFGKVADIYGVQGWDTAQLLIQGLDAVQGDMGAKAELISAMEKAELDSPRGLVRISAAHNPIQDFYLREVKNGENVVIDIAAKQLADPARGCKMA